MRLLIALLVGLTLYVRPSAACTFDSDCPGAGCGGQVCNFGSGVCVAAGTNPGYCASASANCKCYALGATCSGFVCSITLPPDMAGQSPPDMTGQSPPDMTGQSPPDLAGAAPADMSVAPALCVNDTDCAGAQCGGQVCRWPAHQCVPAGTDPQGTDGWCTTDADCKCKSAGATCNQTTSHCTATLPQTPKSGCSAAPAPPTNSTLLVGLAALLGLALLRPRRA